MRLHLPLLPLLLLSLATLPGCGKPELPDSERPPEPQATALRDAIAQPIEQAKAAQTAVDEAARAQRAAIDAAAATSATPPPE